MTTFTRWRRKRRSHWVVLQLRTGERVVRRLEEAGSGRGFLLVRDQAGKFDFVPRHDVVWWGPAQELPPFRYTKW